MLTRNLLFVVLVALVLPACNKEEDTTTNTGPVLVAPTNLRAYSAGANSVGLLWNLSTSESDPSFVDYGLNVKNPAGTVVSTQSISKGTPETTVSGLTEGTIYTFVLRSRGTGGTASADSASVSWSPARRLATDSTNGPPIQVYEFASSSGASGLQFNSVGGYARTQSLSAGNPDRVFADVFLQTNQDGSISLDNMAILSIANAKNTFFSTVTRDVIDLDDPQLAPPASSTYTLNTVTIPSATVTQSRILYAHSVTDDKYVRILIQRNTATSLLYYSTSPNRYVRVQLSYQNTAGNFFAKFPQ